jgi:hypothetical protein
VRTIALGPTQTYDCVEQFLSAVDHAHDRSVYKVPKKVE